MGGEYSVLQACQQVPPEFNNEEQEFRKPVRAEVVQQQKLPIPQAGAPAAFAGSSSQRSPQQFAAAAPAGSQWQEAEAPPSQSKQQRSCTVCTGINAVTDSCFDLGIELSDSEGEPSKRQMMTRGNPDVWHTGGSVAPPSSEPPLKELRSDPPHGSDEVAKEVVAQNKLGKARRLADGVEFYTNQEKQAEFKFEYGVLNKKLADLTFTVSLAGSKNMAWAAAEGEAVTVKVGPQEFQKVGIVQVQDRAAREQPSLQLSFTMKFSPMSQKEFAPVKQQNDQEIKSYADVLRDKGISCSKMGNNVADIRAACKAAGTCFVDLDFYPGDTSLYDPAKRPSPAPPIIWRRPKDFLADTLAQNGGKLQLYSDGISPGDIKQGALGDCWFLASLAALTEFHSTIETILQKSEPNDEGVYEVVCWKNGRHTSVIIDDWFPCNPATGQPVYSHTHGDELWVIVLEKAWAKLHGSYQRIEAGIPYQALMDLVCEPGLSHPFAHHEKEIASGEYFKMLKRYDDEGYVMTASTPGKDEMTKSFNGLPSGGIVPGHAYTLKSVQEYEGTRLLQLRNPWGQFEWDGKWSDKSREWTPAACQALQYKPNQNDGLFWMTDEDFFAHFDGVQAAHCRANNGAAWSIKLEQVHLKGGDGLFVGAIQFHVDVSCEGFATLWQLDERQTTSPKYSRMPFALYGPVEEDRSDVLPKEVMRSPGWRRREMVREMTLTPGRYFIAVWNLDTAAAADDTTAIVMLHLAGTAPPAQGAESGTPNCTVLCQAIQPSVKLAHVTSICSCLSGPGAEQKDYGDIVASSCWLPHKGFGIALANKAQESVDVTIDFTGSRGLQLVQVDPRRPPSQVATLTLAPRQEGVLGAELRHDPQATEVSVQYRLAYEIR